jgi:ATP-dependent DNA ligase
MAVGPPLAPMLGRLVRELPGDGYVYEPKWDGFRCLAFLDRGHVELRSRHDRPLARYFPEIVDAVRELGEERLVLDGELVVSTQDGPDFAALMSRLHPAASRVEALARDTPAKYVVFDLLSRGSSRLLDAPLALRRPALEELLVEPPGRIVLIPQTDDAALARQWLEQPQPGIDGVMAKRSDGTYEPGARRMLKVKLDRTADCVAAGFRGILNPEPAVASLLLGLYDESGRLHHVGVASGFARSLGRELLAELRGLAVPLAGHPWEHGYLVEGGPMGRLRGAAGRWTPDMELDWVPIEPQRVCEVGYDHVDGTRFRHPARFRRWRPDRDARSCYVEQLL